MIKYFTLFENLQKAEQIMNFVPKRPGEEILLKKYNNLKEFLSSKGKLGYLYVFALYMKRNSLSLELIKDCINDILRYNIKIDVSIYEKLYEEGKFNKNIIKDVYEKIKDIETNKFIDRYAPGFLKKELKTGSDSFGTYFDYLKMYIFEDGNWTQHVIKSGLDVNMLKGKMSMFRDPKEWINYIKDCFREDPIENIKNIKSNKDNVIYFEDDEWILYQPTTHEAMNIVRFQYWCTISKRAYLEHVSRNNFWIIFFNKKEKKESMIAEIDINRFKKDRGFIFNIHDYKDIIIFKHHNAYSGHIITATEEFNNNKNLSDKEKYIIKIFAKIFDEGKIKNLIKDDKL